MRSRALAQIPKPVAEDLTHLGALLREARGRRGFTQAELAQRLKLSPTTVRAAEQGDPAVSAGIFASLLMDIGHGPDQRERGRLSSRSEAAEATRKNWKAPR